MAGPYDIFFLAENTMVTVQSILFLPGMRICLQILLTYYTVPSYPNPHLEHISAAKNQFAIALTAELPLTVLS